MDHNTWYYINHSRGGDIGSLYRESFRGSERREDTV